MTSVRAEPTPGLHGYAQIRDSIRARVARGELRPGDRLPAVRELAAQLGVNVNTVARAYAELAREGVVVTQAGGGTRVAPRPDRGLLAEARQARLRELIGGAVLQALGLGFRPEQVEAVVSAQLSRWRASSSAAEATTPPLGDELAFAGSHDLTLDLLAARLRRREPPVRLEASYGGSLSGLMALARDEVHLAGCHLLDEESGEYNLPFARRLLPGQSVTLVTLALREQGLMVRPGNPRRIGALGDLARPGMRLAARQRGSGTQVLLEYELRRAGLDPRTIETGGQVYPTHVAAAGAVAEGGADVALGIRGAARAYGLDFLPIATERYELAIPERLLEDPGVRAALDVLADAEFRRTVEALGGYDTSETGRRRSTMSQVR